MSYSNCGNSNGNGNGCSNGDTIGPPGLDGKDGKDGLNGTNGTNGIDGKDGLDGSNSTSANPSVSVGAEIVWFEKGRVSIGSGYDYDIRNKGHSINAARVSIRVGKSSTDMELEELRRQIEMLKGIAHRPGKHQHVEIIK